MPYYDVVGVQCVWEWVRERERKRERESVWASATGVRYENKP